MPWKEGITAASLFFLVLRCYRNRKSVETHCLAFTKVSFLSWGVVDLIGNPI